MILTRMETGLMIWRAFSEFVGGCIGTSCQIALRKAQAMPWRKYPFYSDYLFPFEHYCAWTFHGWVVR